MMGYGETTKGYRLYDRNLKRVLHSRDVTCDEVVQKEFPSQDGLDSDDDGDLKKTTLMNNVFWGRGRLSTTALRAS